MKPRFKISAIVLLIAVIALAGWAWSKPGATVTEAAETSVVSPNVPLAKYDIQNGVKVFKLTAEPVEQEVSKGVFMNAWGYNGGTPGPTIVVRQGDRIRVEVTNNLPEPTSVHWHGLIVPNEMDGVPGVENGTAIQPGKSFTYEFTVKQAGTFMYHSHVQPSKQEMMGLAGMFISLPAKENAKEQKVDRDYTLLLQEWQLQDPMSKTKSKNMNQMNMGGMNMNQADSKDTSMAGMDMGGMQYMEGQVPPGTYDVNPEGMDWNTFTFNGKQFPATAPMEVKKGEKVRVRLGNISMQNHPIHLHGHDFKVVAKDGARLPEALQYSANTIDVAPGETYDIEFTADNPGTWIFHCHLPHHTAGMDGAEGGMLTAFHYDGTPWPPAYKEMENQQPMNEMDGKNDKGMKDMKTNDSMDQQGHSMGGMNMSGQ